MKFYVGLIVSVFSRGPDGEDRYYDYNDFVPITGKNDAVFSIMYTRVSWVDNLLVIFQVSRTAGFFRNFIFLHFYMT